VEEKLPQRAIAEKAPCQERQTRGCANEHQLATGGSVADVRPDLPGRSKRDAIFERYQDQTSDQLTVPEPQIAATSSATIQFFSDSG